MNPAMKTSNFETIEWLMTILMFSRKIIIIKKSFLRAPIAAGAMLVLPAL